MPLANKMPDKRRISFKVPVYLGLNDIIKDQTSPHYEYTMLEVKDVIAQTLHHIHYLQHNIYKDDNHYYAEIIEMLDSQKAFADFIDADEAQLLLSLDYVMRKLDQMRDREYPGYNRVPHIYGKIYRIMNNMLLTLGVAKK